MNKQKLLLAFLVFGLFLSSGCSKQRNDSEAQKLIDQQTELVKEGQLEIENFLGEMTGIKDSMALTQKRLANERQTIAGEMKSLEKEKVLLEMSRETDKLDRLQSKKDSLNQGLEYNLAAEKRLFDQIERLEYLEDSLVNANNVITGIIKESEINYKEDIINIDQQLSNVERQQLSTQRLINLDKKKIDIANRKVQLYQDEILVLSEEKTHQLRTGEANEQIAVIEEKIINLEKEIANSLERVENSQKNITYNEARLSELDQLQANLRQKFNEYHNTKGVINEFAEAEKKRTQQKVVDIQEKTGILSADNANVKESRQLLEQKLYEIEQQISELESTRLPELSNKMAEIEMRESDQNVSKLKYTSRLDSLNSSMAKSGDQFEQESEILALEQQLMTEQAEQAHEQNTRIARMTIIIFAAGTMLILALFYFMGSLKKRKLSKS